MAALCPVADIEGLAAAQLFFPEALAEVEVLEAAALVVEEEALVDLVAVEVVVAEPAVVGDKVRRKRFYS